MRPIFLMQFVILFFVVVLPCRAADFGSSSEARTITTDRYEISIQQNGKTDVSIVSGAPVFTDAFPMVWFDGEEKPVALTISGDATERGVVRSPLGEGQGISFIKGNCVWILQAFPSQQFWTAQVRFVNNSKKNVRIRSLFPWAVGSPGKGHLALGTGTTQAQVLENGRNAIDAGDIPQRHVVSKEESTSYWNVAFSNASEQRSLIAGTLTARRGTTQFRIMAHPEKDFISLFRAECVYDPPVEVPPGERLESEEIYFSASEANILEGLERYASACAMFNGFRKPAIPLPHGWDSRNTKYGMDITEDRILASLEVMDKQLKRYGWRHMAIGAGWERVRGDWEPDPVRFPHGMKWLAEQIHARGMSAGLGFTPFTVSLESPIAKQHPEWLVEPSTTGRTVLKTDERILDVTIPSVYEYVRDLCAKIGKTWGYDALEGADFAYHLSCAERYADPAMTRTQIMHRGFEAVREGFGKEGSITTSSPLLITAGFANMMRIGNECAPIWRKRSESGPWGTVEAATNAARRFYFAPYLWRADTDCFYYAQEATRQRWKDTDLPALTRNQSLAWLTMQAMTGGVVKVGDWLPDLKTDEIAPLTRILPTPDRPARPIDLFERDVPAIWSLPVKTPAGQWYIVAVFNWDETNPAVIPLDFERLGLDRDAYYTVYDFWQDQYFGLTHTQLKVNVPPGSVHLLGLRRYENRPMLLSSDRHFTQGASDHTAIDWNPQTRVLSGTFNGIEETDYNLRILVPEGFTPTVTKVSAGEAQTTIEGKVLKIGFHCAKQEPVQWSVTF